MLKILVICTTTTVATAATRVRQAAQFSKNFGSLGPNCAGHAGAWSLRFWGLKILMKLAWKSRKLKHRFQINLIVCRNNKEQVRDRRFKIFSDFCLNFCTLALCSSGITNWWLMNSFTPLCLGVHFKELLEHKQLRGPVQYANYTHYFQ